MAKGLPLQKHGDINNLSQEMIDLYEPLAPGQVRKYRLLNGKLDLRTNTIHYGAALSIPLKDRIVDIGTRTLVEIGIIKEAGNKDNPTTFKRKLFGEDGNMVVGEFELRGDNVDDQELHCFLFFSHMNASNPRRDASKLARLEVINVVGEANTRKKKINVLKDALNYADTMRHADNVRYAASKMWEYNVEASILAEKVMSYAQNNSELFLKEAKEPATRMKAVVRLAIDNGVIGWDAIQRRIYWTYNQEAIAVIPKDGKKDDYLASMVEWIVKTGNGGQVYDTIKDQLDEKLAVSNFGYPEVTEVGETEETDTEDESKEEKKKPGRKKNEPAGVAG